MAICYRIFITLTNIFFPPLAVIFLTGFGMDTLLNSFLFLAAIIPSHIHGFYLSCTYFHRRRKVRKGRWPGGPKPLIYSENVLHGGARWDEVQELKRAEFGSSFSNARAASRRKGGGGNRDPEKRGIPGLMARRRSSVRGGGGGGGGMGSQRRQGLGGRRGSAMGGHGAGSYGGVAKGHGSGGGGGGGARGGYAGATGGGFRGGRWGSVNDGRRAAAVH